MNELRRKFANMISDMQNITRPKSKTRLAWAVLAFVRSTSRIAFNCFSFCRRTRFSLRRICAFENCRMRRTHAEQPTENNLIATATHHFLEQKTAITIHEVQTTWATSKIMTKKSLFQWLIFASPLWYSIFLNNTLNSFSRHDRFCWNHSTDDANGLLLRLLEHAQG